MLSTTVLSSAHCDTETEMSGMLRRNRIYVSSMKRSQGCLNSRLQHSPYSKRSKLRDKCVVLNSGGIKQQAELF